jgi:hypothetical protein
VKRAHLTERQKVGADELVGQGDATLNRFNLLALLLDTKKEARWALITHLTCYFAEPRGLEPLTFCLPVLFDQASMRPDPAVYTLSSSRMVRFGCRHCCTWLL